jgi:hypothetical protein
MQTIAEFAELARSSSLASATAGAGLARVRLGADLSARGDRALRAPES